MNDFIKKITFEKVLISIIILAVALTFGFIFYLFFGQVTKSIKVLAPNGKEELEIGKTYKIRWKAKGIGQIGIVAFKGNESKWIAKNIPASTGSYDWKIYPGETYGDDYWIAIFEYPWRKGNVIDYSDTAFAVIYSELANCDTSSIKSQWPYIASDYPEVRKVFFTKTTFNGDLGGFEGADKKCQAEAETLGFKGDWFAFIGGDSDKDLAVERMKQFPRKTDGIFVEAKPVQTLTRGATCHQLLGKNFEEFLANFSQLSVINEKKFDKDFLDKLKNTWVGRIDEASKKNCVPVGSLLVEDKLLKERYSFTVSCQNWTTGQIFVEGYPVPTNPLSPTNFDQCHIPKLIDAVAAGGLSIGLTGGDVSVNSFTPYQGKSCSTHQSLICIEK